MHTGHSTTTTTPTRPSGRTAPATPEVRARTSGSMGRIAAAPGARVTAALIASAILGLALGLTMPRGPVTTTQSLLALGAAALVGVLAGWLLRSRWAALASPAALAVAFELARLGAEGPTVDGIRLDLGLYGAIAFISGRGFDALVILFPMALGALWGAALARRRSRGATNRAGAGRAVRRVALGAGTALVLLLAVALARPAGTEPILGPDGQPLEGSITQLVTVPIGGHDQAIMLRGHDVEAPVLLFLEGGPGGTALGAMRYAGEGLEEHFVVATWDQRGTGKSIAAREPVATMTVAQAVADTVEVVQYLRDRFDEERVYVLGSSWGTTLGVLAVQQRPDLFHAYVGAGQMVDQQETDKLMYAESLAHAERVGNNAFAERLRAMGPPPYDDTLSYPLAISSNPEWDDFTRGPDHDARSSYPASLFVAEYTLTEQIRAMGAIADTFDALYPQLQDVDFRVDVPALEVPVYLIQGAHEAPGRAVLAAEWFEALDAPAKRTFTLEQSGHTPHLHEPGRFRDLMAEVVLAETYPTTG